MATVLEKLRSRAAASRERVEGLRAQIGLLEKELAAEEVRLSQWAVAEEAVAQVLAEDEVEDIEREQAPVGQVPVAAASVGRPWPVVSAPVRRADGEVLPEDNEDVVLALASAGRPLRAKQVCESVGAGLEHRHVEAMRVRLKRLVQRGWLTEEEPGQFAIAPGVGDPDGSGVADEDVVHLA